MDKLKMHTPDLADENYAKLAALFPNAITETITGYNEDGSPIIERAVDADILRQEIAATVVEGTQERYQFTWPDKKKSVILANQPIAKTLRLDREKSVGRDGTSGSINTENIYIEGDNLDVLKLLQETYLGKVKMIYIDPPYNTGNDYIYDDDYSLETEEYLDNSGQFDEDGNRLVQNTESNGRFHTDWLNMIFPRLRIAHDLLSEAGVIFVSIDDHEVSNLKKVMDEVFGAHCFIADLIWQKKFSRSNDATYFSTMHDHILCYCKNHLTQNPKGWRIGLLPRGDEIPSGYSNPDNDPRGLWTSVILSAKSGSENLLYEITTPSGRVVTPPSGRFWSCSKKTFEDWKADNRIWFGVDGNGTPRKKTFLSEVQPGLRPNTILFQDEAGNNQEAKQETKDLFDGIGVFDGPKPVRLIQMLATIAGLEKDSIVLDFFSGSATTAHAIMKHNIENNLECKYILVQLQEETDKTKEAYKAGYKTICEIGEERIRRAAAKIKAESGADIDYGFRVFKVDSSNMEDVYYRPAELKQDQLMMNVDNVKADRIPEDLLIQTMLDLGILISSQIEETEIAGKKVFSVAGGYMIACFDTEITEETVTAIAKMKPHYAVFRDASYASDSVATNVEQIFETYSPKTQRKVL